MLIQEILVAYRNDTLYGSGVAKLEDIIRFEMEELGNSDTPSTLLDNFKVLRAEGNDIEDLIDIIDSGDFTEDNLGEEEINRNVNLLMNVIKRTYPEAKYGLWLGTKDSIDKNYEGNATAYTIEYEKPISDLGLSDQGCLFVYSKHPSNYKLNLNESNRQFKLDEKANHNKKVNKNISVKLAIQRKKEYLKYKNSEEVIY